MPSYVATIFAHDKYDTRPIYALKACAKLVLMTRKWNTTKWNFNPAGNVHYSDAIMSAMVSQITGVLIVCLNASSAEDVLIWWRLHGMKIIRWDGPLDIKTTKSEESRPTVPWKGRNDPSLIDIHSSIKAIYKSAIYIMDIHNSKLDVYNPVLYIFNSITDIQTCKNSYGYPWLNYGCQ